MFTQTQPAGFGVQKRVFVLTHTAFCLKCMLRSGFLAQNRRTERTGHTVARAPVGAGASAQFRVLRQTLLAKPRNRLVKSRLLTPNCRTLGAVQGGFNGLPPAAALYVHRVGTGVGVWGVHV